MDLSSIKGDLEQIGINVEEGTDKDVFMDASDVKLPFLVGARNWYSDMSWFVTDGSCLSCLGDVINYEYKSRKPITEGYLKSQCRIAYGGGTVLRDWLVENIDDVMEFDSSAIVKLDTVAFIVEYDKQFCEYSLVITRSYELYKDLVDKGVPLLTADVLLHKDKFYDWDAVAILDLLKQYSMFIPFWNKGGRGVYLNVGDHTKIPSYGANIKDLYSESEGFRQCISNNYGKDKVFAINPHKWYFVMKDVKMSKIWVKSIVGEPERVGSRRSI